MEEWKTSITSTSPDFPTASYVSATIDKNSKFGEIYINFSFAEIF